VRALPVASKPFESQNTTRTVVFVLGGTLPCLLIKWAFHHISLLSCLPRSDLPTFSLINYCLEFLLSLVGLYSVVCPHTQQPLTVSQRHVSCRKRIPNSRNRSTLMNRPWLGLSAACIGGHAVGTGEFSNVHSLP